jgi:hypothetical protein
MMEECIKELLNMLKNMSLLTKEQFLTSIQSQWRTGILRISNKKQVCLLKPSPLFHQPEHPPPPGEALTRTIY